MKRELENREENITPVKRPRQNTKEKKQEVNIPETFADPTLDVTFKMLFGNDILISLLNSLLGFTGNKKIIEVQINDYRL